MNFIDGLKNYIQNKDLLLQYIRQHPIETIENLFLMPAPTDDNKKVRITLNVPQKLLITNALQSNDIYALGSTQIAGKTTAAALLTAYVLVAYPGIHVYYLSLKDELAMDFQSRVLRIIDNMFPAIKVEYKRQPFQNKVILFENNSVFRVSGINKHYKDPSYLFKQLTVQILIIDEFANIKNNWRMLELATTRLAATRSMMRNIFPTSLILLSNAAALINDEARFAFKLWYDSTQGLTAYTPILFYYRDLLDDEQANKHIEEEYKRTRNLRQILINYECMFLPDSDSFIDDDEVLNKLVRINNNIKQKTYFLKDDFGEVITALNVYSDIELYMFQKPIYIGVDIATAYGKDSYAIVGVDPQNGDLVFEWQASNIDVTFVLRILSEIAKQFRNCKLVIERNLGSHIIEILQQTYAEKIYIDNLNDQKPGVYTTQKSKEKMFSILYDVVNQNPDAIKSKNLAIQILSLKKRKGKIVSELEHDDLLMAYCIALYAIKNDSMLENINQDNEQTTVNEVAAFSQLLIYQKVAQNVHQTEEQLLEDLAKIAGTINDKDILLTLSQLKI